MIATDYKAEELRQIAQEIGTGQVSVIPKGARAPKRLAPAVRGFINQAIQEKLDRDKDVLRK